MLGWDQSAWWHDGAGSNLGTILDDSSFEDDALVANNDIVADGTRIERTVRSNCAISSNLELGTHSGGKGWGSVEDGILTNARELVDLNLINIASDDGVVPNLSISSKLNLSNHGGVWGDPVVFSSWLEVVEGELHAVLGNLFLDLNGWEFS